MGPLQSQPLVVTARCDASRKRLILENLLFRAAPETPQRYDNGPLCGIGNGCPSRGA